MKRKQVLAFLLATAMILPMGMNVRAEDASYVGFSFEDSAKIANGSITADYPSGSTQTANRAGETSYVEDTVRGGVMELGATSRAQGKLPIQSIMAADSSYSMSLWYKCKNRDTTAPNKPITLFAQNNNSNGAGTLVLNICKNEEGKYYYSSSIAGQSVNSTKTFDNLDEWQHVTIVYNNAATSNDESIKDTITFYINGIDAGTVELPNSSNVSAPNNGKNLIVGSHSYYQNSTPESDNGSGANASRFFTGMVDDIRVYKSAITAEMAQAIYDDTKHSCTVGVSSVDTEGNTGIATVSGGGACTYGSTVTVSAPELIGYEFVGWYKNGYTGDKLSDKQTAEISINKEESPEMTVVAVYKAVGTATLEVAGNVSVSGITEKTEGIYEANLGTQVTVVYNGAEEFLYWKNASGKKVSSSATYSFPLVSSMSLTPVVKGTGEDSVLVEFVNGFDQVLSVSTWTSEKKKYLH